MYVNVVFPYNRVLLYMHILQNNNDENNEPCFIVNVLSES